MSMPSTVIFAPQSGAGDAVASLQATVRAMQDEHRRDVERLEQGLCAANANVQASSKLFFQ
jgi:hypothetical protein